MRLFIPGPSGRLEAILWKAGATDANTAPPPAAAVVCHPHPLAGGTMDNNVVFRTARGLQSAGLAVLRFNFRGAGQSEGLHDGAGGEEEDVRAALDHLQREFPGVPLWGAGFSFGSRTLASYARREPRLERLLLVALPCRAYDCSFVAELRTPTHLLMAGEDQYGTLRDLGERVGTLPANIDTEEIEHVDHFFRGKTPELERRVRTWAEGALTHR